ncbi:MAG: hypothetical protein ABSD74_06125 [Rhizomicrobium sp.]|jgi:hypothetical protein
MKTQLTMWLAGAAFLAGAVQAEAQPRLLNLPETNFDMWCQEHEHLPPKRCDKRLPQDDAAFQAYVNLMESYETQKLNSESRARRLERAINENPANNPPPPPMPSPQN